MEVEKLYVLARQVAVRFSIPTLDKDDLVQEAVVWAWRKCNGHPPSYVRKTMINRLLNLAKSKNKLWQEQEFVEVPTKQVQLRLPNSYRLKQVTIAMVENGLCVAKAARQLDWSYYRARLAWQDAKLELKRINGGENEE